MHTIQARNVNHAYHDGLRLIREIGEPSESRNGRVLVAPTPVMTVYERPRERVLFDEQRDANPFFHLFESVWMLAGKNDGAFLDQFVRDFTSRYAEPGSTRLWGAYGHRWRGHFEIDQLDVCVRRLQRDPNDRRVVISMWDPVSDLIGPDDVDPDTMESIWVEGSHEPRDLPCNTQIYLRVRSEEHPGAAEQGNGSDTVQFLDLTVMCRSNDIVWGAYGANAVHFSVLQEYLAARLGVQVGRMYQFSNNWHMYVATEKSPSLPEDLYEGWDMQPAQMVSHPMQFTMDCERFVTDQWHTAVYANEFFRETLVPMRVAHGLFRDGDSLGALRELDKVGAPDWQLAARRWISRRMK